MQKEKEQKKKGKETGKESKEENNYSPVELVRNWKTEYIVLI